MLESPTAPCSFSPRCTRWYLPLLLLPLPHRAPLLSPPLSRLHHHTREALVCPVFFGRLLLTFIVVFTASSYSRRFLSRHAIGNRSPSTHRSARLGLRTSPPSPPHSMPTLMANYSRPLPPVIRAVDRCWCDLGAGGLFEPYNISQWEHNTVRRLVKDLERDARIEDARLQKEHEARKREERDTFFLTKFEDDEAATPQTSVESPAAALGFWARLKLLTDKAITPSFSMSIPPPPPPSISTVVPEPPAQESKKMIPPQAPTHVQDSLIRTEYDLRPYGLGMIVDLRWAR